MEAGKLHIFTAIEGEARAIRAVLPAGVELTVIGIRAVRLPAAIEGRAILLAGFAGGLDPALRVGDVVRDEPAGAIFTSTEIVATVQEKAELFRRTGARAVDMEGAIVREFAERTGMRFYSIRAISDTADEAIDPMVLKFIDETGRLRPGEIAKGLVRNPAIAVTLNRLRINSGIAGRALAAAVRDFLDENSELSG